MKARYLVPVLLFLFSCTAINSYAQENPVIEKMSELEWMIGKWKQEGTLLKSGNEIKVLMNCDWLFPQTIIQCDYFLESAPEDLIQILVFSYDTDLENYTTVAYASGIGPLTSSFVKNGDSWSWQGQMISSKYKDWTQMIYTPKGDVINIVAYASRGGGVVEKTQEAVVTRID